MLEYKIVLGHHLHSLLNLVCMPLYKIKSNSEVIVCLQRVWLAMEHQLCWGLWIVCCLRTIWWDTECCCPADLSKITSLYEFSLEQWMPSDNDTVNAYWEYFIFWNSACKPMVLMPLSCITLTFSIIIWEFLSCSSCRIVSSVLFIPNGFREGKQDRVT